MVLDSREASGMRATVVLRVRRSRVRIRSTVKWILHRRAIVSSSVQGWLAKPFVPAEALGVIGVYIEIYRQNLRVLR